MAFEHYLTSGQKRLRMGYTTGTSAALAAMAATEMIFTREQPETVSLMTPKGLTVDVVPHSATRLSDHEARCGVIKDAGDDPDVTDGLEILATVRLIAEPDYIFRAGPGVGTVTLPGLDQAPGEAAINTVPRQMIQAAVSAVCDRYGHAGGAEIEISIPGGEEIAKKTFNPQLGITGGLSILGTSGIVEPMSEQALIDTIELELRRARADGHRKVILTPGNYGSDFIELKKLNRSGLPQVKISNFFGNALDLAAVNGFEEVYLVSHIGKIIKLAAGIMNTHSKMADGRREVFCTHAALAGAKRELIQELFTAATTDACLDLLETAGLKAEVMETVGEAIDLQLRRRASEHYEVAAIVFSNVHGVLYLSPQLKEGGLLI